MNIDLFDQTLLFAVNGLVWVGVMVSGLLLWNSLQSNAHARYDRERGRRRFYKLVYWLVGGALLLSVATWATVQALFTQDVIPIGAIAWVLPVFLLFGLLIVGIRSVVRVSVALGGLLLAILLVGLIANQYYHYYGTLAAALQGEGLQRAIASQLSSSSSDTEKSAVVLEQYYQAPLGQLQKGTLVGLSIPSSTTSYVPRQGRIYLPPALQGNDMIHLPVIVLLAGYPGNPIHWEQAGLLAIMNDFASKHKGLAPIVAVVDFTGEHDVDTECVDSKLGSAETYLTKDVPTYLKSHYQVATDPAQWTIGGYSAGGTCSTLIATRNPSVYQNFMNISGDAMPSLANDTLTLDTLFNSSIEQQQAHTPNLLLKAGNPLYRTMHGWYYYADSDKPAIISRIKEQAKIAQQAGVDVQLRGMKGHHSFEVWKQGYVDGLPWVMNKLRLTQP
jgi:S-formylglutathione hydrolase FrmB